MKRIFAVLLALGLLCGCAGGAAESAATAETMPQAAPAPAQPAGQSLNVYYEEENPAAAKALEAYAAACKVTLATVEDPAAAGLAVLAGTPGTEAGYRTLAEEPLLAAAAQRAGTAADGAALPLGKTLYAYWADSALLTALLGENFELANLQSATWAEWSAFAEALAGWIDAPAETAVTLGGVDYLLPAEKPEAAANLNGVFALATGADAFTGPAYSSALVAAGDTLNDETLAGPLNGLLACFALETNHLAGPDGPLARSAELPGLSAAEAAGLVGAGKAVFYRGRLSDAVLALPAETCQRLVPVPQKCNLTDEDVSAADYNVTGLLNYPVLVTAGWLAIPAGAEETAAKTGTGFILWLYSSGAGNTALTDALGLITPWNTASDRTALGALQVAQVSAGVIPGAALSDGAATGTKAAMAPLLALEKWAAADKAEFIAAAEQALGAAAE